MAALLAFRPASAAPALPMFTVDSNSDVPDGNLGDGVCDTGAGACTLRAVVMRANASGGAERD
ncbi:MAG: hypothetical protein E6J26_07660 [Chloroflexi bacterium]|nr:MAG: hypothetical protein E6J26_07660 [Chloroflexota bacterium]